MGSRNYAQVAPTPETVALNAYIFMYAGHSLVTPHHAIKQLWWTDERIEAKITRAFVVSKLRGQERDFLHRPLAFGEGLTDDTYLDWILDRAKRLFLILTEIGVPDQIFGCIDDSWTDDDLPLPLEDIASLELSYETDETLNKRFYGTQFLYLLRQLQRGSHIDYGPKEHIPMDYDNTYPPAVMLQVFDRVHFPDQPEKTFMRRKFPLFDKDSGQPQRDAYTSDIDQAKGFRHEHIADLWASYTSDESGYLLSSFVPEHTLATFMEHRTPPQLMRLSVAERKVMLCEWMHCLADTLAFIHDRGTAHGAVRPSNVWITDDNRIAFADIGCIRTFQKGKKWPKTESYDYAAPETRPSKQPTPSLRPLSPAVSTRTTFGRRRPPSISASSIAPSTMADPDRSSRSNSVSAVSRAEDTISPITPVTPDFPRSTSFQFSLSRKPHGDKHSSSLSSAQPSSPIPASARSSSFPPLSIQFSYTERPGTAADIFSLGCIYLDLLTFLIKGKLTDFIKFRSTPPVVPKASKLHSPSPIVPDVKGDTSFHASLAQNPLKLAAWLTILRDDAQRQAHHIHSPRNGAGAGKSSKKKSAAAAAAAATAAADAHTLTHLFASVPALLDLVEHMLTPIPSLRPSALDVRNALLEILQSGGGDDDHHRHDVTCSAPALGRTLCCEFRDWTNVDGLDGFEFGFEGKTSGDDDNDAGTVLPPSQPTRGGEDVHDRDSGALVRENGVENMTDDAQRMIPVRGREGRPRRENVVEDAEDERPDETIADVVVEKMMILEPGLNEARPGTVWGLQAVQDEFAKQPQLEVEERKTEPGRKMGIWRRAFSRAR